MDKEDKKESIIEEVSEIKDSNELVDEVLGEKKKSKVKLIISTLIALVLVVAIGIAMISWNMFGSKEVSVAMVNSASITQTDFDTFFTQQEGSFESQGVDISDPEQLKAARQQVLETLVNQKLLLQGANDAGVIMTDEDVQSEYDKTVSQFESAEALQAALGESNLTEILLRERIRIELIIQSYLSTRIDQNVTVSDEEIQALYDQYVAQGSNIPAFEEVSTQLADQIKQQKFDSQVSDILGVLRESADIEMYLE